MVGPPSTLLADPTDEEEILADALGTAVARPDGSLAAFFQPVGHRPLSAAHVRQLCDSAAQRAAEFAAQVEAAASDAN